MILSRIHSPDDVKQLSRTEIPVLAREIRRTIIETVQKNGGHMASNLGVVELTIALHRVFSSPQDAIVWDTGHQCYAHKLLTGRYDAFGTIRSAGGLSGFPKRAESVHDFFDTGHASTSISSALGLLMAWDLAGKNDKVVAVIGDGALTGGMAFEALSHAGQLARNLIVVLNDNQMSIDHSTGAVSRYLSRITMSAQYQSFRYRIDRAVDRIPQVNKFLEKFIVRFKRALKGLLLTNNLFVDLDFEYVGPLNGHDEKVLEEVLRRVCRLHKPVVVHVVTKKGRGYRQAEDAPDVFHGVRPLAASGGVVAQVRAHSFTDVFSDAMVHLGTARRDVVAVTAAMAQGTGLASFARHFPDRFFDVGIAEQHAVTFAGGMARGGFVPVVCIYSTFLQRAIDQIIEDIALAQAHVVLVCDRAGVVPGDGETHQGLFDIALLRPIPDICILSPASAADLTQCLSWAVAAACPVVIRYPKLSCPPEAPAFSAPVAVGRGTFIAAETFQAAVDSGAGRPPERVLLVCTGGMYAEVSAAARMLGADGITADIYALRFIKPIDEAYFTLRAASYDGVLFVEDGIVTGGIGEHLAPMLSRSGAPRSAVMAFPERFYAHGTRQDILEAAELSAAHIAAAARALVRPLQEAPQ
ncbi:MAG: 1-deoxy-D-xylulose-5-phosphate synthase [Treponema sp.]|nr:1-deoxy-D-xylulose-5-phosphate synthase [Treponema sp.]